MCEYRVGIVKTSRDFAPFLASLSLGDAEISVFSDGFEVTGNRLTVAGVLQQAETEFPGAIIETYSTTTHEE